MTPKIVFEDDSFLVIDKGAGVVVNRAGSVKGETIQDWAEQKFKISNLKFKTESEITREFRSRGGVIHRLDKDTSGLLVIAKTPEAFSDLKDQFKSRSVVKKYCALVHGRVEPSQGTIEAPIERSPFNRKHFGVFPGGREARTEYCVLKYLKLLRGLKSEELSLLELTPHTGRTHQIRVHLKYINHPVVADPIYGGRKNCRADLAFCPRLFLHAFSLTFRHPMSGEMVSFEAPLPAELERVLKVANRFGVT